MGAQSATGKGKGSANKPSLKELGVLNNAPSILVAGRADLAEGGVTSPPSPNATVYLPNPLPGSPENYVVLITGLNATGLHVGTMHENSNGDFDYFTVYADDEGTVMYIVCKAGTKPNI